MTKYTVFQYVLLHTEEGDSKPQIIDEGFVVAQNQDKARLIAARNISDTIDVDTVEVLVRPF